jgi:TM2 domain-containing membrane protein YozV
MFCQQCGKSNQNGARFCDSCGAPLPTVPVQQVPPPAYQQPVYAPQPVYQQAPAYQPMPPVQPVMPGGQARSPGIAGVLSFLCCGLGQLYNGETLKGAALFIGAIIASIIFNILGFLVVLFSIFDAFTTAKKINQGLVPFTGKSILFWPVIILYIILIIVAVMFLGVLASGLGSF